MSAVKKALDMLNSSNLAGQMILIACVPGCLLDRIARSEVYHRDK